MPPQTLTYSSGASVTPAPLTSTRRVAGQTLSEFLLGGRGDFTRQAFRAFV